MRIAASRLHLTAVSITEWTTDDNTAMIYEIDGNGDGMINKKEFYDYYKKKMHKLTDSHFFVSVHQLLVTGTL